jgi:hypothetical protein
MSYFHLLARNKPAPMTIAVTGLSVDQEEEPIATSFVIWNSQARRSPRRTKNPLFSGKNLHFCFPANDNFLPHVYW